MSHRLLKMCARKDTLPVIGEWIGFYNAERPHSSLGGKTPAEAYAAGQPVDMLDKTTALPTSPGPTTEIKYDKQDSDGMIRKRNTP